MFDWLGESHTVMCGFSSVYKNLLSLYEVADLFFCLFIGTYRIISTDNSGNICLNPSDLVGIIIFGNFVLMVSQMWEIVDFTRVLGISDNIGLLPWGINFYIFFPSSVQGISKTITKSCKLL